MITRSELRALPSLAGFTDHDLDTLVSVATPRKLSAGAELFRDGEPGRSCVILVTGELDVVKRFGSREARVATLQPGALVGQVALIDRGPRSATVTARTRAVVLEFARDDFDRLLLAQSPLALRFQEQIAVAGARHLRESTERLAKIIEATRSAKALVPVDELSEVRVSLGEWGAPTRRSR